MIRIVMNRLKHTVELELPTDYERVLVCLWKLGLDRDPRKYTLRDLKAVFHYDTPEEHQMIRMIESGDTLMFALISLHQMIAPPYSIAELLRGKISAGCYNTADVFYADLEKKVFKPSTCQSSFFFPISAELVDKKGIARKAGDDVLLKYEYMVGEAMMRIASQSLYWKTELFSDVEGAYEKLLSACWMVERIEDTLYSLFYMAATNEKQPNAYAQYQLGKMYRDGIGTEVDLEESSLWYAKAYAGFLTMEETMADDKLYYRLGSMSMTGTGTNVNLEQARYYFEKAAELGNADALYGLGKLYLKPEFPDYDPAKAVEYLEQAVAKGNAFAKYQLGKLLCQGELVPKDIARGLPLLEELAQNGVTFASYIAGKVYLKEEGWQDIKKAILYFRQAAEDGNSFAEYQLGRIYYFGNGVRADREKGLEYLKEAASHGNEYAANLLLTIQQQHTWGVASCTASLIAQLGRIFQEQDQKQNQRQRPRMDRKHRREIEEKKQAMGLRD